MEEKVDKEVSKDFSSINDLITKSRKYLRNLIDSHVEQQKHDAHQKNLEVELILNNLEFVGKKWIVEILWLFDMNGGMIFNDLMRRLNGISSSLLSDRLKELKKQKLIKRTIQDTKPISVKYELTDKGKGFIELSLLLFFYMSGFKI